MGSWMLLMVKHQKVCDSIRPIAIAGALNTADSHSYVRSHYVGRGRR